MWDCVGVCYWNLCIKNMISASASIAFWESLDIGYVHCGRSSKEQTPGLASKMYLGIEKKI